MTRPDTSPSAPQPQPHPGSTLRSRPVPKDAEYNWPAECYSQDKNCPLPIRRHLWSYFHFTAGDTEVRGERNVVKVRRQESRREERALPHPLSKQAHRRYPGSPPNTTQTLSLQDLVAPFLTVQASDRAPVPGPSVLNFPHHITYPIVSLPGPLFISHDTNLMTARTVVGASVPPPAPPPNTHTQLERRA